LDDAKQARFLWGARERGGIRTEVSTNLCGRSAWKPHLRLVPPGQTAAVFGEPAGLCGYACTATDSLDFMPCQVSNQDEKTTRDGRACALGANANVTKGGSINICSLSLPVLLEELKIAAWFGTVVPGMRPSNSFHLSFLLGNFVSFLFRVYFKARRPLCLPLPPPGRPTLSRSWSHTARQLWREGCECELGTCTRPPTTSHASHPALFSLTPTPAYLPML
jgi:hypothetical protein